MDGSAVSQLPSSLEMVQYSQAFYLQVYCNLVSRTQILEIIFPMPTSLHDALSSNEGMSVSEHAYDMA